MNNLLAACLNLDLDEANDAFESVLSWLDDMGLADSADEMGNFIVERFRKDNPLKPWNSNKVYCSPTAKMKDIIYTEGVRLIREAYPNADIYYDSTATDVKFHVDSGTYKKARKAVANDR